MCAAGGRIAKLVDAGLDFAILTLHSTDSEVEGRLLQVPDALQQQLQGLEQLLRLGVQVDVRCTLTAWNTSTPGPLIALLRRDFPDIHSVTFALVRPTAQVRNAALIPDLGELRRAFLTARRASDTAPFALRIEDTTPACFMDLPLYSISEPIPGDARYAHRQLPGCASCPIYGEPDQRKARCFAFYEDYLAHYRRRYGDDYPEQLLTLLLAIQQQPDRAAELAERPRRARSFLAATALVPLSLGIKPVWRDGLPQDSIGTDQKRFKALMGAEGILAEFASFRLPPDIDRCRTPERPDTTVLYLSRDPAALRELHEVDHRLHQAQLSSQEHLALERRMGALLGYPDCCVQRYVSVWRPARPPGTTLSNIMRLTLLAAQRSERLDWRLNHLVDDGSRQLIVHAPCSFDCVASLEQARRLEVYYRQADPDFIADVERWLQRPVLIFANEQRLFFDGEVREANLHYHDFHCLRPELDGSLFSACEKLLRAGDRLRVKGGGIEVFLGERSLGRLGPPPGYQHPDFPLLLGFEETLIDQTP